MFRKFVFIAILMLTILSPLLPAHENQLVQSFFQPLQPEDMTYYQNYHWSKPVPRRDMYQAQINGQEHMHNKMMTCLSNAIYRLPEEISLFKDGGHEPSDFMKEGNPEDFHFVSEWQVYSFAERIFQTYNGSLDPDADDDPELSRVRNEFWAHCLSSLDVWLFTQAASRRADGDPKWREFLREGEPLNKQN